jgi:hypothetical protein
MRHGSVCIAVSVLAVCLCAPAVAQWKWRDASGRTQYSDLPPPQGTPESAVLQRPSGSRLRDSTPAPAASGASAASSAALPVAKTTEPELEAKLRKEEQEKAAKAKVEADRLAAQRAENCKRAQAQQRTLQDGLRVARLNDKGEREVLDDKGRAVEMERARAVIASDCN